MEALMCKLIAGTVEPIDGCDEELLPLPKLRRVVV
eukprot:CAMPEP_0115161372 /NCGR_PEP_ID=MMETSP0227-20121206/71305_1 /TAXON_ID=89957 /ORGANISM="Polarella glacialis, Strain CCMP 1383" /LENGTH=34 /DNA_ID= /DNA_START= /DNA_END= /DNA_ORIENTATION=